MLEMRLVWIAVFGALGSLARYGVGLAAKAWLGASFPYGTLAVNLVGGFVLALIVTLALSGRVSEELRLAVGVGFCGAFTTFSTFELEVQQLIAAGRPRLRLRGLESRAGIWGGAARAVGGAALSFEQAEFIRPSTWSTDILRVVSEVTVVTVGARHASPLECVDAPAHPRDSNLSAP